MNTNCRGLQRERRCIPIAPDFNFADDNGAPVQMKGYWLDVVVRQGNRWKILVSYHAPVAPPPSAPAQTK